MIESAIAMTAAVAHSTVPHSEHARIQKHTAPRHRPLYKFELQSRYEPPRCFQAEMCTQCVTKYWVPAMCNLIPCPGIPRLAPAGSNFSHSCDLLVDSLLM